MFAATAAGLYLKVEDAMNAMGSGFDAEYIPNAEFSVLYAKRYQQYKKLGMFIESQLMLQETTGIPKQQKTAIA
jgi:L-ribulokinase